MNRAILAVSILCVYCGSQLSQRERAVVLAAQQEAERRGLRVNSEGAKLEHYESAERFANSQPELVRIYPELLSLLSEDSFWYVYFAPKAPWLPFSKPTIHGGDLSVIVSDKDATVLWLAIGK